MNYTITLCTVLILALPACSLRKEQKKPSTHQKRKARQLANYASCYEGCKKSSP